ncbi:MAG TPA: flagellar hook-basal body protein [Limnochordales bacterium]
MLRGLYTSASGMLAEQVRVDVLAHNLANVQTAGFKRQTVIQSAFPEMLLHRVNDPMVIGPPGPRRSDAGAVRPQRGFAFDPRPAVGRLGTGTYIDGTYSDMTAGALRHTGNPLDMALEGDGFFTVETPAGLRFTRDGRFTLDGEGWLVTPEGHRVLGEAGPIRVRGGTVHVTEQGEIWVDGALAGVLAIRTFADPQGLVREGSSLWAATEWSGEPQPAAARVHAGYLEDSNVNVVMAMVELITAYRSYEANQRVIQAFDQTLGKAVNELGRV